MIRKYNVVINGSQKKKILIDVTFKEKIQCAKVVIFSHGFKGFKDWGPFNKIAEHFAENGFIFVKFNFSHNGTNCDFPNEFVDLSAFGLNNYCLELNDLDLVINWIEKEFKNSLISLLGHSRGGALSMIKSYEDNRISSLISWAAPSDLLSKLPDLEKANRWRETNVLYVYNGRTKQNMPMYYQFYENCLANYERLNIQNAISYMKIPHLHIHGDDDHTVLIDEAYNLQKWNSRVNLYIIKDANHVFNAFHPYNLMDFPNTLKIAIDKTISFLKGE